MAKRIIKLSAKDIVKKAGLKDGYTPIKGKDYFDGAQGKPGVSVSLGYIQKNISDTIEGRIPGLLQTLENNIFTQPDMIRDSLSSLEGEDRLDKSAIKGLDEYDTLLALARKSGKTKIGFIGWVDEKVKYNISDSESGYLEDKVVAGTGISLAENSDRLEISTSFNITDYVPYTGATSDVDLGSHNLTTTGTGTLENLLIGSDANFTNFPYTKLVSSQGNTTYTNANNIGIVGEGVASDSRNGRGLVGYAKSYGAYTGIGVYGAALVNDSSDTGAIYGGYFIANSVHSGSSNRGVLGYAAGSATFNYGVRGEAIASGAAPGYGVYGYAGVDNSSDTASATGIYGYSADTHSGGINIGVYGYAVNGLSNYSFYGAGGTLYNSGSVGIGTIAPGGKLGILSTTEQLRLQYDSTHYTSFTVDSTGLLTLSGTLNVSGGDTYWTGDGSGLPYGEMGGDNIAHVVDIVSADTYVEIDGDLVGGELNLVTFPDDHYCRFQKLADT